MYPTSRRGTARAAGLLLGFAADRLLADPARWHPVSGFGRAAVACERTIYSDSRLAGVVHAGVLVSVVGALGMVTTGAVRQGGWAGEAAGTAIATWAVLGGTSLGRTGAAMAGHLAGDDLTAARALLPSLCGRDPSVLDAEGITRATLESVAENTSDAAVGALFWGAVAGIPGLFVYRASNTLDAMVGYRSQRYRNFGWAAARGDDVLNLLPARLTGALTVALAPVVGGSPRQATTAWFRDAAGHPSPNAGVVEAATAGALGISLGGRTQYAHGVEMRPQLGNGRMPAPTDLRRAVQLSTAVQYGATFLSAALAVAVGHLRFRRRPRR
ncbi:cobalamin biosynthesis protein [Rhodococcus tibetensis]|uniref:Cobalamin biosynthesis protein CobD n=1 Tax=Rhodococcus tibetensis TaxID=2965064 RepID=A0ABT1Q9L2_9NOCA|nr:cobalamin biosynthesis protein [Rhodococcus sp. FXJ9.536]MCQ4118954.1 cobalamin biosynthesis protein [Rhodococcus sp. FXJ9.536]